MIVRKYILAALVYIALLSFILQIIVVVVSWLICVLSPDSGVQSLLSQEGIRWMAGKLPEAMSTDTLLSLLYISLAVGTLIGSGLLACFIPQNVNASERTEYREQSTENRVQSTENRVQRTENRVQSIEERAKMEDEREKEKEE